MIKVIVKAFDAQSLKVFVKALVAQSDHQGLCAQSGFDIIFISPCTTHAGFLGRGFSIDGIEKTSYTK